ncbi:MAG: 3-dehydroquinate synthase [Sulfurospirillaceae bacterium]|nr:3-dehydroquinate synthase [Sulfurospirillaceae bacterium]
MKIPVNLSCAKPKNYTVFINELDCLDIDAKVVVVTNPTVASLHLEKLLSVLHAKECHVTTIPDGEMYKNLETLNMILEKCFEHRLDRKSVLIAFGGGVIGDMTGFAASIFQRGIDFIQIPTTLLSQVDASVGGKTGINNAFGKNLIGSFWQPRAVYCESAFLKTLPKREFSAGVAEIVKMAVTFDADFFAWLEKADLNTSEDLDYAITSSIRIKSDVVAQDEKEMGIRAVLNYGHTFAHVIENETKYEKYLHGEAVAIGMVMANCLAQKLGLMSKTEFDRVKALLKKYNLPTSYTPTCYDSFYDAFFLDKKSANNSIKFILPCSIGSYAIKNDIDKATVIASIREAND